MVGVNTNISRRSSDGLAITGINFAVQSNVLRDWLRMGGISLANTAPQKSDQTDVGIKKKEKVTPEPKKQTQEMESLPDNKSSLPQGPLTIRTSLIYLRTRKKMSLTRSWSPRWMTWTRRWTTRLISSDHAFSDIYLSFNPNSSTISGLCKLS